MHNETLDCIVTDRKPGSLPLLENEELFTDNVTEVQTKEDQEGETKTKSCPFPSQELQDHIGKYIDPSFSAESPERQRLCVTNEHILSVKSSLANNDRPLQQEEPPQPEARGISDWLDSIVDWITDAYETVSGWIFGTGDSSSGSPSINTNNPLKLSQPPPDIFCNDIEQWVQWIFMLHKHGVIDLNRLQKGLVENMGLKQRRLFEEKQEATKNLVEKLNKQDGITLFQKILLAAGLAFAATVTGASIVLTKGEVGADKIPLFILLSVAALLSVDDFTGDYAKKGIAYVVAKVVAGGGEPDEDHIVTGQNVLDMLFTLFGAGTLAYAGKTKDVPFNIEAVLHAGMGASNIAGGVLKFDVANIQNELRENQAFVMEAQDHFEKLLAGNKEVNRDYHETIKALVHLSRYKRETIQSLFAQ